MDNSKAMSNNINHKPRIGKGLINMLMFQMYGDEKLIYREYIQNARDAINDAVKEGLLEDITSGCISITINPTNKFIKIRDNGTGISVSKVESVLLNIADSNKDGETSAGQFGIGRLVGGYFCKELSFKTSFYGEDCASEIIFDIDKIKSILNDDNNDDDATEVISKSTSLNLFEENKNEHYFEVTLIDVDDKEYPTLLDQEKIYDYLKEVAPVDYSAQFKNQLINTSVNNEYKELQNNVGHFKISVNGCFIEKGYGLRIKGTDDVINSLEYFSLQDESYGLLAWGWFALTDFTKAIPTSDNNSHFRLRKHNIQVGDKDMLSSFFPEKRGNKYFYGEIHIVNPKIKLNSARDGLAPTPEGGCLKRKIKDYFRKLHELYYFANKTKNAVKSYNEAYDKLYSGKLTSDSEIKTATDELKKAENNLNSISKKASGDSATKKVFNSYEQQINSIDSPKNTNLLKTPHATSNGQQTRIEIEDPFEELIDKYSKENIRLIRKICELYLKNCPNSNRKLIEELQKKVLKELS